MTHPITGHSDRCLCHRCEQVVDVPRLLEELALLRELEAWTRECLPHLSAGKLASLLTKLDELRARANR